MSTSAPRTALAPHDDSPSTTQALPSPTAPPQEQQRQDGFPPQMLTFPRQNWSSVVFAWPVFYPGEDGLKVNYAARACSRRWMGALHDADLGSLGVGDFALAVFDKTDEMNSYLRVMRAQLGVTYPDPDTWLRLLEHVIRYAHSLCHAVVSDVFPDSPLLPAFANVRTVLPFVRSAMGSVWQLGADSYDYASGPRLPRRSTYNHAWVDPYIPDPATVPPRPFTRANDDPKAPADIIWIDHKGNIVPQPKGIDIEMHGETGAEPPSAASSSPSAYEPSTPELSGPPSSGSSSSNWSPHSLPSSGSSLPGSPTALAAEQPLKSHCTTQFPSPLRTSLRSPSRPETNDP
ncbi:hypothetical protein CC85DRAFT_287696 [Cutaneotrichosporon oleaginosum]|uniref:Uncharacterized protein n=1 Tax=Cutaneotrichosporon oleaginosum TaxID=879819 RepID=A0A0J1AXX7_9TREE|nr:uncharacterized protein CC85DRAFT_287696 [Cutaneotrichosporon oleaginosum]KLT40184.1 hypothetical protein CC85DRAFT_287696 [Cutaneotrichosporon oleaginosum]TXT10525.1 hypothetical protein COLE_04459 [Cutaneotrichosporon oleaginosum]